MAKKKQEKKVVENVDIDALVDEGKNIDTVKASEVIAENKKVEEDSTLKANDEAKEAEANDIIEGVLSEVKEEEETTITFDEVEGDATDTVEEGENIDDVIEECTGEMKKSVTKEPWYVTRARREADYYSW